MSEDAHGPEYNPPSPSKIYLGDGVYAQMDGGMVKLTAENGIRATDIIYLEPEVLDALNAWYIKIHSKRG